MLGQLVLALVELELVLLGLPVLGLQVLVLVELELVLVVLE